MKKYMLAGLGTLMTTPCVSRARRRTSTPCWREPAVSAMPCSGVRRELRDFRGGRRGAGRVHGELRHYQLEGAGLAAFLQRFQIRRLSGRRAGSGKTIQCSRSSSAPRARRGGKFAAAGAGGGTRSGVYWKEKRRASLKMAILDHTGVATARRPLENYDVC
jgi:hypothetical protein